MPVNTISVATAVTPTVIETYLSHYLNRKPLAQKPTAHISYHEGLELIRRFLNYASLHTVEELQEFTSQWVPVPHWVHVEVIDIPTDQLTRAAECIQAQLGPAGIKQVGGKTWWQWRRDNATLKAEWIEMRKDYDARKKAEITKGQRIMLYVHGGAYFFGSVDEHRYQMQRHARKLKARVLAPRYRLAPQFPFPCGLLDCLATYFYLLEQGQDPSTIILAGDSAGGGMVVSMLVTLRDQGVPLPAGAILISPWVDLTHSFPSLGGDGKLDYIPAHGFVHKPSESWPPPNADDRLAFEQRLNASQPTEKLTPTSTNEGETAQKAEKGAEKEAEAERVRGFSIRSSADGPGTNTLLRTTSANPDTFVSENGKYSIGPKSTLSLQLEDSRIEIKDQIQLYAANHLLTHPLVSPALQPTLGGLPPLLIQVGGGELLRDEQIYLAHKAAQPLVYLPPPSNHLTAQQIEAEASKYRPTNVQLQVWDDLCHVAPTLSFTRPAKHMYRSIAQFGAWALARSQKTTIDILDDDDISILSTESDSSAQPGSNPSSDDIKLTMPQSAQHVGFESIDTKEPKGTKVGKAGDPLPAFEHHMIRQRIDRHGRIYAMEPYKQIEALNMAREDIGVPKPGPVNKWMKAQSEWNGKFAKDKLKVQKKRIKDMEKGYEGFEGESPPPTALAGRILKGMKAEKKSKRSWGMSLWSLWGSKHDSMTIEREEKTDRFPDQGPHIATNDPDGTITETSTDGVSDSKPLKHPGKPHRKSFTRNRSSRLGPNAADTTSSRSRSGSRSRYSNVADTGQVGMSTNDLIRLNSLAPPIPGFAEATRIAPERKTSGMNTDNQPDDSTEVVTNGVSTPDIVIDDITRPHSPITLIPVTDTFSTRPTRGGVAYPFRLKVEGDDRDVNASTLTLQSVNVTTPRVEDFEGPGTPVKNRLSGVEDELSKDDDTSAATMLNGVGIEVAQRNERPGVDRFFTAGAGDMLMAKSGDAKAIVTDTKPDMAERPGVERFETAMESLTTLSNDTTK
ncbi:alpha/beta-hydrolase [Pleomassaria siparia CBS 279.74]|uniref:Alpha/beta-hydrolase n=1 Tax=Pleomassaria siparia CBS 279.74 TaxID=1314801 RepID=A0A6G1KMV5_9PLEO|nr:alpha/beta-hydrolase [Pleomassaria siparia CBS 279.74]